MQKSKWNYRECNLCGEKVPNKYTVGCNETHGIWCKECIKEINSDEETLFSTYLIYRFCKICNEYICGNKYMYAIKTEDAYKPCCLKCKVKYKTNDKLYRMTKVKSCIHKIRDTA